MSQIFVSHSKQDNTIVERICAALTAAAVTHWVDYKRGDDGIAIGTDWTDAIQAAMNDANAGLLVLSRKSAASAYVKSEWNYLLAQGKRVYIALIEPVPLAEFPHRLITNQYADLAADFDGGLRELVAAIAGGRELDPADDDVKRAILISGAFPRWQLDLPLIGRDAELAAVRADLASQRLTLITGLGGVGKTRLAAEVVVTGAYPDGVLWHTLSPESRVGGLTQQIREHLRLDAGLSEDGVWGTLARRGLLLVLDNAEDCRERRAYAERLNALDHNGGTRILMTSRAEWDELRNAHKHDLSAPSREAAVAILKEMIALEPPAFPLDGHEAAIAEAARQHPRLMQYAVKWANAYPAEQVIATLNDLKGADAEAALDELVRRTLDQLRAQARGEAAIAALRRLAVCRGGFSFDAARALVDDVSALTPQRQWGLLRLEDGRYDVDPLVRAAAGEDETAHRPHYDFFKALAEEHDRKQDYLGLDVESANLEAAFEWALREDAEAAYWLANATSDFLSNRGRFAQRLQWAEQTLDRIDDVGSDQRTSAAAIVSLGIAYAKHPLGDQRANLSRTIEAFERALHFYTPKATPLDYAMAQLNLGGAYSILSELEDRPSNLHRAIAAYQEALHFYTPEAMPLAYAMTQTGLGNTYWGLASIEDMAGNLRRAIVAYKQSLRFLSPEVAPLAYAMAQNNLGVSYRSLAAIDDRMENLRQAVSSFEKALNFRTPETAPHEYAETQMNLGGTFRQLALEENREVNLRRAEGCYLAALDITNSDTNPLNFAGFQHGLGNVYYTLGDLSAAIICWREAERYYRRSGDVKNADLMLRWIAGLEGGG
ncbi:MAG: TIR domain-containing protein [Anaerolineae bacterium]|nr:TIR domain-containing protein [Anaerolineae bacterium]